MSGRFTTLTNLSKPQVYICKIHSPANSLYYLLFFLVVVAFLFFSASV